MEYGLSILLILLGHLIESIISIIYNNNPIAIWTQKKLEQNWWSCKIFVGEKEIDINKKWNNTNSRNLNQNSLFIHFLTSIYPINRKEISFSKRNQSFQSYSYNYVNQRKTQQAIYNQWEQANFLTFTIIIVIFFFCLISFLSINSNNDNRICLTVSITTSAILVGN